MLRWTKENAACIYTLLSLDSGHALPEYSMKYEPKSYILESLRLVSSNMLYT